jgi:predicted MFS family arabinose efflux permease
MTTSLQEDGGLPPGSLAVFAIVAAFAVANIYYMQPLLNMVKKDFGVSDFLANTAATTNQIGYAAGLFLILPLGDLLERRKIILVNCAVLVISLLGVAFALNIYAVMFFSLITGVASVMPQILLPIVSQFSEPEKKNQNTGIVISGILIGVLI